LTSIRVSKTCQAVADTALGTILCKVGTETNFRALSVVKRICEKAI
jgi:hypothetical protein